jgi:GGDEF domain-containing protein
VARIGGDEFMVIAPGAGSHGARRVADALEHAASQVFDPGGDPLRGTAAWALFPDDGDDADDVVRAADRRLYAAKRSDGPAEPTVEAPPVAGALAERT